MKEPTLEKNNSAALSVTTNAQRQAIWRDMKELTLEKNNSAAPSVTTNAQHQAIWRDMQELTLLRIHSTAPSVTKHSERKGIWRNMKEFTLVISSKMLQKIERSQTHIHHNLPFIVNPFKVSTEYPFTDKNLANL